MYTLFWVDSYWTPVLRVGRLEEEVVLLPNWFKITTVLICVSRQWMTLG